MDLVQIPNQIIEKLTISLVREYLVRKGYFETLKQLTTESIEVIEDVYSSRRQLGQDLKLESLMKINKSLENPLKSMLEVLIKSFVQETSYNYHVSKGKRFCNRGTHPIDNIYLHRQVGIQTISTALMCNDVSTNTLSLEAQNDEIPVPDNNEADLPNNQQTSSTTELKTNNINSQETPNKEILNSKNHTLDINTTLKYNGHEIQISLENVTRLKQQQQQSQHESERSPNRLNSLRNSLSEDAIGSPDSDDPNDNNSAAAYHNQYQPSSSSSSSNLYPNEPKVKSPSKQQQSNPNLFSKIRRNNSSSLLNSTSIDSGGGSSSAATSILETKQNLLAEAALSAEENELRQLVEAKKRNNYEVPDSGDMILKDIEDDDDNDEEIVNTVTNTSDKVESPTSSGNVASGGGKPLLHYHKPETSTTSTPTVVVKTLDVRTWLSLKSIIYGAKGTGNLEGWIGQGFTFNQKIPFGLAQRKGGPCGVLAVLQSFILKNLLFGSEYFDDDENYDQVHAQQQQSRFSYSASASSLNSFSSKIINLDDLSSINNISSKRILALVSAIVEILWKCAMNNSTVSSQQSQQQRQSNNPTTTQVTICLTSSFNITTPATEIYVFKDLIELKKYIRYNIHRFDCISLVYSIVLTRGLDKIQDDMDFPNSPLLGQHGYCTQELVNLLTIGKAISNSFDHQIVLDDKILKGIPCQVDIGFLSLFEYYDSCQVGNFLKNPKFPIWIICSESHFSVLFSNDSNLASINNDVGNKFNLYYYDGLARQEQLIKLSIETGGSSFSPTKSGAAFSFSNKNINNNNFARPSMRLGVTGIGPDAGGDDKEDLTPPLEKCIRTKWKNAYINWTNSEPIL